MVAFLMNLALLSLSFLSFSVLRGPLGLARPPQSLRTEQGFNLTFIQLHGTLLDGNNERVLKKHLHCSAA